jgi:hypothetical protein
MPPNPNCPEFHTGPPVDSSDLMFRDAFLAELWEALRTLKAWWKKYYA